MSGISGLGYNSIDVFSLFQKQPPQNGAQTGNATSDLVALLQGMQGGGAGASPSLTGSNGDLVSPATFQALLASQEQGPGNGGSDFAEKLFAKIDANGDGKISKAELEAAFTAVGGTKSQADAVFAKVDANGDGSVSAREFTTAMPHGHRLAEAMGGGSGGASTAAAASTTKTLNPDGSTTTTITYADGTQQTYTIPAQLASNAGSSTPAAANAANGAKMSQMLKILMQLGENSSSPSVAVSA